MGKILSEANLGKAHFQADRHSTIFQTPARLSGILQARF
jgi:hypothetical protein